eukprot:TRINITY_DN12769_c0_g1_i1.p2 TRINITY_DN12769_c0_g1~~TRINITY_DN12769_c0_g1_i1.p2  ORF type:complete len:254 (+),score=5.78 TRINITY_DN12769_c0_g1_i1:64-825(+)
MCIRDRYLRLQKLLVYEMQDVRHRVDNVIEMKRDPTHSGEIQVVDATPYEETNEPDGMYLPAPDGPIELAPDGQSPHYSAPKAESPKRVWQTEPEQNHVESSVVYEPPNGEVSTDVPQGSEPSSYVPPRSTSIPEASSYEPPPTETVVNEPISSSEEVQIDAEPISIPESSTKETENEPSLNKKEDAQPPADEQMSIDPLQVENSSNSHSQLEEPTSEVQPTEEQPPNEQQNSKKQFSIQTSCCSYKQRVNII